MSDHRVSDEKTLTYRPGSASSSVLRLVHPDYTYFRSSVSTVSSSWPPYGGHTQIHQYSGTRVHYVRHDPSTDPSIHAIRAQTERSTVNRSSDSSPLVSYAHVSGENTESGSVSRRMLGYQVYPQYTGNSQIQQTSVHYVRHDPSSDPSIRAIRAQTERSTVNRSSDSSPLVSYAHVSGENTESGSVSRSVLGYQVYPQYTGNSRIQQTSGTRGFSVSHDPGTHASIHESRAQTVSCWDSQQRQTGQRNRDTHQSHGAPSRRPPNSNRSQTHQKNQLNRDTTSRSYQLGRKP